MTQPSIVDAHALDRVIGDLADGSHLGIGGVLDRNRPNELCRAVARRRPRDLHVYSFLAGAELEPLAEADAIATLSTGYLDPRAGATCTEAALNDGRIGLREMSELIYLGGLLAAAHGLPFWATHGGLGSDIVADLGLREVICPYTATPVLAVPATPIDLVLIHAEQATAEGAILVPSQREFLDDADVALVRAGRRTVATVDRLVDPAVLGPTPAVALMPFEVDAIVVLETAGRRR